MTLVLYTYDWLPDFPRGFVRDLRIRWLLEELGRPYEVATVPLHPKSAAHVALHPFGQVPILQDGDLTLFESGAIALHLAEGTPLLPSERRAEVTQWLIAALNSVEITSACWMGLVLAGRISGAFGPAPSAGVLRHAQDAMQAKLRGLEPCLQERDWIAGTFSVADILMADVLRIPHAEGQLQAHPSLTSYVSRATSRPAFGKAMQDHMAHWQAADAARR